MKTKLIAFVLILLTGTLCCLSQGFVNLNFENAVVTPDRSSPYYPNAVYTSDAIPGWTATGFIGPNDIFYNDIALGAPSVSLFETNSTFPVLDGRFSVDLYGGSIGASISQTAVVPASALSLSFKAQSAIGTLLVSLGGQNLSFLALASGSNYTLYGANLPVGLAGQSEQLVFSALEGNNNNWVLDDIQFSSSSVPEPSVLGLLAVGGLLLGFVKNRQRR